MEYKIVQNLHITLVAKKYVSEQKQHIISE